MSDLIGELATRSEEFSRRWASHDVRYHHTGTKALHHPVVGDLELSFEVMQLPADPDLNLVVYNAEPGTHSADGLRLLASWAATEEAERLLGTEGVEVTVPSTANSPSTARDRD